MEIWGAPPHVASITVSLKSLLLIPFYLGLLPAAEYVPLLEAYFVMHLKGVIKSMAWTSTPPSDIKGKISCLVPMTPSLEKEEGKPGWSLKEQAGWEATRIRKERRSNRTLHFQVPACLALAYVPRVVPDFV